LSSMLIFGGTLADGSVTNSVHCFDLKHEIWIPFMSDESKDCKPSPRSGMSGFSYKTAQLKEYIFIFGGQNKKAGRKKNNHKVYNDLWCLDIAKRAWSPVGFQGKSSLNARYYHTFHCLDNGRLFLLGGRNSKHELCQYLEEYNIHSSTVSLGVANSNIISRDSLLLIFFFSRRRELARVCSVCRRWNNVCKDDQLWYRECLADSMVVSILSGDSCTRPSFRYAFYAKKNKNIIADYKRVWEHEENQRRLRVMQKERRLARLDIESKESNDCVVQ